MQSVFCAILAIDKIEKMWYNTNINKRKEWAKMKINCYYCEFYDEDTDDCELGYIDDNDCCETEEEEED